MSVTSESSSSKVDKDESGEKSFACPSMGCNQKFTTANELAVHKQKHQMTLTLGPSKLPSLADVLPVDQTPTPTRFLHLGNQIGLFDELNPFDKEFKTAQKDGITSKQRRAAVVVQQLQALSNKSKSPSTPTRTSDGNSLSVPGQQPLHVIAITPTLPSPVAGLSGGTGQFLVPPLLPSPQGLIPGYTATSPLQVPVNLLSPTLMPFSSGFMPGMQASLMADAQHRAAAFTQAMFAAAASGSSPLGTSTSFSTLSLSQQAENSEIFTNASASNDSSSTAVNGEFNQTTQRPGPQAAPPMIIPKQERPMSVSSVTSETNKFPDGAAASQPNMLSTAEEFSQGSSEDMLMASYPVVVQLPNGQTTCIGVSSTTATLSTNTLVASASTSLPSVSTLQHPIVNSQTSTSNHPSLGPRASSEFGSTSSLLEAKQKLKETLTTNNPNLQQQVATVQPTSSSADLSTSEAKPVRRRGRQSQDIDPDLKRQRFLERNRAAASRCRSKKKIWVNGLESKAKGLSQTNVMLQNEIAALKDEIATLKQLLLSHRDCPITKMQQQNMALAGINLDPNSSLPSVKPESSGSTAGLHPTLSGTLSNNSADETLRTTTQQSNLSSSLVNGSLFLAMSSSTASS